MFPTNTPGGAVSRLPWGPQPTQPPVGSNVGQNYISAVQTQGKDYDTLMKRFGTLADSTSGPTAELSMQFKNLLNSPYQAAQEQYRQAPNVTDAMSRYKGMADTGGYSPEDLANLRARATSPIRAAYANARMQLDRQNSLGGGYSPNRGVLLARMARQQGSSMADAATNTNANIAQMVAEGKRAGLSGFANLGETEAGAEREVGARNVAATNQGNLFNKQFGSDVLSKLQGLNSEDWQKKLEALRSMQSLYGTTPALASTFGNQAIAAASMPPRPVGMINNNPFVTGVNIPAGGVR